MSTSSRPRRGAVIGVAASVVSVLLSTGYASAAPSAPAPTAPPASSAAVTGGAPVPDARDHARFPGTSRCHRGAFPGERLSRAQLEELQAAVDAGHQPWRLDRVSVAQTFVLSRFGWEPAAVVTTGPHTVVVTDPASGAKVRLHLRRPVRSGPTGVWVVIGGVWIR